MGKRRRTQRRLSKTKDLVNKRKPKADEPIVIHIRNSTHTGVTGSRFFNSVDARVMQVQVQTRPVADPRVLVTSKTCGAVSEVNVALRTGSTTMEPYEDLDEDLFLKQYGFNPYLSEYLEPLMPIDKVFTSPVPRAPKVDYSSQSVNLTTTTETNGTTIDQLYNFGTDDKFQNINGSRFFNSVDAREMQMHVQTRPMANLRVVMTSKVCGAGPKVKDAALRSRRTTVEPKYLEPLMPIDKVVTCPVPMAPTVDYSSQCVNPTTTTGTNGTTIDQLYNFSTDEKFEIDMILARDPESLESQQELTK